MTVTMEDVQELNALIAMGMVIDYGDGTYDLAETKQPEIDLDAIFTNLTPTAPTAKPSPDPIADLLQGGTIRIEYSPRQANRAVPFMDFSRGNRRYVDMLVRELKHAGDIYSTDKSIMLSQAAVKRGTGKSQTWQDFIDELFTDKVEGQKDFSEAQLKHIPTLVAALAKGKRLANCAVVEFYDVQSGEVL